jgi:ubiquinol-cytochrome c reductase cytochrome c1 subunit
MIKKLLGILAVSLSCSVAYGAEGGYPLDKAPDRINDLAALQNGAKLFVNYCMGCHSANSLRYSKLTDLGLTKEDVEKNLLFTSDKIGSLMTIAMTPADGKAWFGTMPPDLSVIARAKSTNMGPSGVDYVYTFLRAFYRDNSKKSGWDNAVFPSVAMPHALWAAQGPVSYTRTSIAPEIEMNKDGTPVMEHGKPKVKQWTRTDTTFDAAGFKAVKTAALANHIGGESLKHSFQYADKAQTSVYENNAADLANFLGWMAEPDQLWRKRVGVWVLLFLGLFFVVTWRLNAAFWKHVQEGSGAASRPTSK